VSACYLASTFARCSIRNDKYRRLVRNVIVTMRGGGGGGVVPVQRDVGYSNSVCLLGVEEKLYKATSVER
jgi:hypothetical protein